MRVFRYFTPIAVGCNISVILCADFRIGQIFYVIPDIEHNLIGYESLIHKVKHMLVNHFADNQLCFFVIIRTFEYLSHA